MVTIRENLVATQKKMIKQPKPTDSQKHEIQKKKRQKNKKQKQIYKKVRKKLTKWQQ